MKLQFANFLVSLASLFLVRPFLRPPLPGVGIRVSCGVSEVWSASFL